MDRPSIPPGELVAILCTEQWRSVALDARLGRGQGVRERLSRFWQVVETDLVQLAADRLLQPGSEGQLFHHHLVRDRILQVARRLGTFQVPDTPEPIRDAVTEPMVDFLLSMGAIDLDRTCAQQWERTFAIRDLAASYQLPPETFMRSIPSAEDWIIRLTLTPESFRTRERDRIDRLHPDLVSQRIAAFEAGIRRNVGNSVGGLHLALMLNVPQGDQYWRFRAEQMHKVEQRIHRIWPPIDDDSASTETF